MRNLESHQEGIALARFPKTFRDAIKITRRLGHSYLWIDSLAIIQDSKDDWQEQSAQMASIYENALLTIAATTSNNCGGGCSIQPWDQVITTGKAQVSVDRWGIAAGEYVVKLKRTGGSWRGLDGWSLPLHTRGWVLQEAVLSRRTLHMPFQQMVWQCREHLDYEDAYLFLPLKTRTTKHLAEVGFLSYQSDSFMSTSPRDKQEWWDLAENYSRRALTYENDKLPAIAGVLQFYEKRFNTLPLLGLWEDSLASDLAWTPDSLLEESLRSRVPGLPSWTWLSFRGEITKPLEAVPYARNTLSLFDWSFQWTDQPFVSTLTSSSLILKARTTTITLDKATSSTEEFRETFQTKLMPAFTNDYGFFLFYRNDLKKTVSGGYKVTLLLLCTYQSPSEEEKFQDHISFLALLPDSHDPLAYVRIGVGYATRAWGADSAFVDQVLENWEETKIRLV